MCFHLYNQKKKLTFHAPPFRVDYYLFSQTKTKPKLGSHHALNKFVLYFIDKSYLYSLRTSLVTKGKISKAILWTVMSWDCQHQGSDTKKRLTFCVGPLSSTQHDDHDANDYHADYDGNDAGYDDVEVLFCEPFPPGQNT